MIHSHTSRLEMTCVHYLERDNVKGRSIEIYGKSYSMRLTHFNCFSLCIVEFFAAMLASFVQFAREKIYYRVAYIGQSSGLLF